MQTTVSVAMCLCLGKPAVFPKCGNSCH